MLDPSSGSDGVGGSLQWERWCGWFPPVGAVVWVGPSSGSNGVGGSLSGSGCVAGSLSGSTHTVCQSFLNNNDLPYVTSYGDNHITWGYYFHKTHHPKGGKKKSNAVNERCCRHLQHSQCDIQQRLWIKRKSQGRWDEQKTNIDLTLVHVNHTQK